MSNTKLTLSLEYEKIIEFKKKALDAGITLSHYLLIAATLTPFEEIVKYKEKEKHESGN